MNKNTVSSIFSILTALMVLAAIVFAIFYIKGQVNDFYTDNPQFIDEDYGVPATNEEPDHLKVIGTVAFILVAIAGGPLFLKLYARSQRAYNESRKLRARLEWGMRSIAMASTVLFVVWAFLVGENLIAYLVLASLVLWILGLVRDKRKEKNKEKKRVLE